jgi:hypothetical protein
MTDAAQRKKGLTIESGGWDKTPIVSIGDDFEMAVVQGRGVKVELAADAASWFTQTALSG